MNIFRNTSKLLITTAILSSILCIILFFSLKSQESVSYSLNYKAYSSSKEASTNPPDWIQGDWAVTTPHGSFGVKFQGNQMWVVDMDGTMRTGSYRYDAEQNIIYPDFDDSFYQLDNNRKVISAGGGYYFHRI